MYERFCIRVWGGRKSTGKHLTSIATDILARAKADIRELVVSADIVQRCVELRGKVATAILPPALLGTEGRSTKIESYWW